MGKSKNKSSSRKDGRRLRSMHPMDTFSPYIMVNRNDATNYFADSFNTEAMDNYIRQKRKQGLKNFGVLHVILACYVRCVSQRPGINRFIRGQKIYARNEIVVNMDVRRAMSLNEEATIIKVKFDATDTAEDVYNKFKETYEKAMAETKTSFDNTAKILNRIPGLVKKNVVWWLKLLDYFGLIPKSLTAVSPFHGSMFITSMGSLGIPSIYHHLYNFGNVPLFIAFGARYNKYELNKNGEVNKISYMDFNISCDERICDGFYYASTFKLLRRYLNNPAVLDTPVERVVEDIE